MSQDVHSSAFDVIQFDFIPGCIEITMGEECAVASFVSRVRGRCRGLKYCAGNFVSKLDSEEGIVILNTLLEERFIEAWRKVEVTNRSSAC